MSVGSNLQEMENVVTKGAKPAEPMDKVDSVTPGQSGSWEDLGGPTPENYRTDDNSAKLKEPSVKTVSDVVNRKAKSADPTPSLSHSTPGQSGVKKEEIEIEDEELLEEEDTEETIDSESEVVAEYSIEEDIDALLSGEELSEEFQEKARTIFEAAINSKVSEIKKELEEKFANSLVEEVESIKENLVDRVDAYLEYVADEWIHENTLVIEHGLKTEMTESFLTGMKQLFEEHYVTIPEDRYDVIESMVDKLDEMEGKLNEQIERNVALNKRLAESVADVIFAEVSEGLALSQKDKLASLAENVEFDGEEGYREKLVTLRESYFSTRSSSTQGTVSENLTESFDLVESSVEVSPRMEAYLTTLGRVSKK
jgi:hypothetical protein